MDVFSRIETAGPDEVLLQIRPAIARRAIGAGSLAGLGLLAVWLGYSGTGVVVMRGILILLGAAALYGSLRLWSASNKVLELTLSEFRELDGRLLCLVEDIEKVDRSFSAVKPANGFLVTTKSPGATTFAPGLWWRFGRRVGVGGVAPGHQTKAMAQIIEALLVERGQLED